ncbi:MAG: CBS domain-containing protein [Myxococcota bacterium]
MDLNEIMTPNPVTVQVDATVADAFNLLQSVDVRHLPVVEGSALVGMVSDRDLYGVAVASTGASPERMIGAEYLNMTVGEVMSGNVLTVNAEDDVGEIIDTMIEQKVGALPVQDNDGRLVGIVSYIDLLRAMRDLI